MERPWLILRRVLQVDPPGDDDMPGDADQGHAAVGEAEEHVAAVDVAVEAQDERAAVGEPGEEEDPQVKLEESVVNVNTDAAASEAAHAARGAAEPDFIISVAPPARISYLVAGPRSHPDPDRPDMYPYIIAAGRFCLLVHFSIAPFHGTNFSDDPRHSHLVLVRHFRRTDDGQIAACAVRVPNRPPNNVITNIESVGLAYDEQTGRYMIAELIVTTGCSQVGLIHMSSDTGVWQYYLSDPPLEMCQHSSREWVPHGTVTINTTVLWFDLSWGIISCDLAQPPQLQILNLHRLPLGRVLRAGAGDRPDLHLRRCIAVSDNLVRYVEIIKRNNQAATVTMWSRDVEDNSWVWNTNYSESFEDIWDDDSYKQTGLPRYIPFLAGVSPVNSNVVYFSLDQQLFGVNVPEHTVVDCEEYEPLNRQGPRPPPIELVTSQYLITWNLEADDGAINGGHHQPDELSDYEEDYEDSSYNGSMDEGDVDYPTPPE